MQFVSGDSKSVKQREGERRHWHKKGKKLSKTEIDTESESAGTSLTESRMESQKIFPNYLIAMQITNPKVSNFFFMYWLDVYSVI